MGVLTNAADVSAQQAVQAQPGANVDPPPAWEWDAADPRIGLRAGLLDAGEAARGLELVATIPRPAGFTENSDLAFRGSYVFMGNFWGFNVFDVSDPTDPELIVSVVCPGNQGDVSVYENLLFQSVQENIGRLDCGTQGVEDPVSPDRFKGVRVFDITDVRNPRQVAAVQTCRGSHTHSLVTSSGDPENVYVYVSAYSPTRPPEEVAGCSDAEPEQDPNTSRFQIEVIQVPVASPENARIVNQPRIFGDPVTGSISAIYGVDRDAGEIPPISACHDITAYPDIGLAAGACRGDGILLDISDPVNPVRLDDVSDPNFSFWHSATFNNDGTKLVFTDEWGGGIAARCRAYDPPLWGANAIFDIVGRELRFRSYYKLPVPQTEEENCVAHNGSLIPVPGRDIKAQAWYQGGISVFDFTDAGRPFEIAFFDRGPIDDSEITLGGHWSAYWFNGYVYGSEIARGLDVLRLVPSEHLSENEIAAARLARTDTFNPQHQPRITWPTSVVVAKAYLDQLIRGENIDPQMAARVSDDLDAAAASAGPPVADRLTATAAELEAQALDGLTRGRVGEYARKRALLAAEMEAIAATLR